MTRERPGRWFQGDYAAAPLRFVPQASHLIALRPDLALEFAWGPIHIGAYRIPQDRACCWTERRCLCAEFETEMGRGQDVSLTHTLRPPADGQTGHQIYWTGFCYAKLARTRSW
jgi:hypothetical protein